MTKELDIHNTEKLLSNQYKLLKKGLPAEANEIEKYINAMKSIKKISPARQTKILSILRLFRKKFLKKPYRKATKHDLFDAVTLCENNHYTAETKATYFSIVRAYFRYVKWGVEGIRRKDHPKISAWINAYVKKSERNIITSEDILEINEHTNEVQKLIDVCIYSRDKAFLSCLYESGARISEIGNLTIGRVIEDKYSYQLILKGKTGTRVVRIIESQRYLNTWLDEHPDRHNKNAPLWVNLNQNIGTHMSYASLLEIIKRTKKRAKLDKRIYPHLFRHTRTTNLLNKKWNESHLKAYMGWDQDSSMLKTYSHVMTNDANERLLEMHGIIQNEETENTSKKCYMCQAINPVDSKYCYRCKRVLDIETLRDIEKNHFNEEKNTLEMLLSFLDRPEVVEKINALQQKKK